MAKKSDPAHIATDAEIAKIEKLITKEYKKAHKQITEKCEDYFARFAAKDAKWQEWVSAGTKTEKEYKEWRKGQMMVGKRWEDLRDTLAEDYTNAAKITQSIAKGHAPEVYAINHNYATFEVEKGSLLDTSYTLYSRESVEYMYKGKPKLYHTYGKAVAKEIKEGKQHAWDRRRITSVLTQAILQGESIPNITRRLEKVTAGDHKAAIRNARTMMTGVQNAGRVDAYNRALDMGIPVQKQWLATLDGRTRHWHRELDGVIVDNDKPFQNEFGDIMFPGDPEADAANVYNCRCTLLAAIKGFELDLTDPNVRPNDKLGEMTYEEWLAEKKSVSNPIDLPEQKAANIQGAWWKQYGGGAAKQSKFSAAEGKALMEKYEQEGLNKVYSGIWTNKAVTPADYPNLKKQVNDKKWNLDKQIEKAKLKGDADALAKYQAQKDLLLDFEEQGKKWLKLNPQEPPVKAPKPKKAVSADKTAKAAQKANPSPAAAPVQASAKEYKNIWANKVVKPEDYPNLKKQVNDKKWNLNKQIDKAKAKGDMKALAKYQAQMDELLDFEKEGQKFLKGAKSAVKAPKTPKVKQTATAKKASQTAQNGAQNTPKQPKPKKITEKQAAKAVEDAQKNLDDLVKTQYDNIWKDPVTAADYSSKKASIPAKKQYLQDKYDEAVAHGWSANEAKFKKLLDDIDDFEAKGKAYETAKKELDAAKKAHEPFIAAKEAKLKPKIDALKKDLANYGKDTYDLSNVSYALNDHAKVEEYPALKKTIAKLKKEAKDDIDLYSGWSEKWAQNAVKAAKEKLDKLEKYEEAGKKYVKVQKDLEKVEKKLAGLRQPVVSAEGGAYSQARKDAALWARDGWDGAPSSVEYRKNDAIFDKHARPIHAKKTAFEHEGYYHYTWGSGPFNSPLAGFNGSKWTNHKFLGPGKVDINVDGYGSKIRGLTQLCGKSKQPVDFWVQSGQTFETLEGMLKIPYGTLSGMSDAQLQQFVGSTKELPQFISGAINKGGGSYTPGNMLFNIYCPKGSEALYVLEDGRFRKSEHEMILQRGGTYKITKIYWGTESNTGKRKLIVDMELRLEKGYNKFQQ